MVGFCKHDDKSLDTKISWLVKGLLASKEGPCSVELVNSKMSHLNSYLSFEPVQTL